MTPRDIEELKKLVAADPRDAHLLQHLGEAYQRAGDNQRAADTFMQVADDYERDGEFLKAMALLRTAQKLDTSLGALESRFAELEKKLFQQHKSVGTGLCAPEIVDSLQPLWLELSVERQVELGCKWVDYTLRVMLADHFERCGASGQATFLKTLPVIDSLAAMQFADERTEAMDLGDPNIDASTAFFSAKSQLAGLSRRFLLSNCCFMAVMGSRLSFGDDRVVQMMQRDLTMRRQ